MSSIIIVVSGFYWFVSGLGHGDAERSQLVPFVSPHNTYHEPEQIGLNR